MSKFGALAEFLMARRKIFSVTNVAMVIEKVACARSDKSGRLKFEEKNFRLPIL